MYGSAESKPVAEGEPLIAKQASLRRRKQPRAQASRKQIKKKPSGPVLTKIFVEETPPTPRDEDEDSHHHSYVYSMLNPRSNRPQAIVYKYFIATVIIVDILFFIVSTEPHLTKQQKKIFIMEEGITSTIFLVEYIARLCVCTESHKARHYGPFWGRLRYILSPPAIIDALATFPFFIERFTGWNLPTMTYLRVFRLLRIMKTQTYAKAFDAVNRVIYYNREILYVALMVCIFLVLVTSVLLYYLRPKGEDSENFDSIADAMYLATLMLTGQGIPEGDLPWYTKSIVLMTSVFSVAMFAIPASMLTWGFEAEAARLAARARQRSKRRKSGIATCDSSTSSSSWDVDDSDSLSTSDEEYQKIIAGEEDSSEDEEEKMKKLMEKFNEFDKDKSGGLTLSEFMKLGMQPPSPQANRGNIHNHFGAGARARGGGDDDSSLVDRMDALEDKVDATNKKLDQILKLLKNKSAGT